MENKDYKIILFTICFPYTLGGVADIFIGPEIPYLASSFPSVIIVPEYLEGKRRNIPPNITVETSLGELLKSRRITMRQFSLKTLFLIFTSLEFYSEIIKKPKKMLQIGSIKRLISDLGTALITKNWIIKYIEDNHIDLINTIFYTYWLNGITMGISLAKKKYPEIIVISRAHGYDLYEENQFTKMPEYSPFRPEFFSNINKIFPDSDKGKQYLSSRYPVFNAVFSTSRLGVSGQDVLTNSSKDKIFRIVTCSAFSPEKRIELLIRGLEELGRIHNEQIFEWTHIGDGPLRAELEQIAKIRLPQNVKYTFLGYVPEGGVISFYQNNPIDVFINISSSEGIPVSIMEAQSCGIMVIATAVGGNPEIVTNDNGLLLSENPEPCEIANAICLLLNDRNLIQDKKIKSFENWNKNFNSEKNFQDFVKNLIDLIKNRKKRALA